MEELTCSVCSEVFKGRVREPVVLPQCGHTFCRPCLLNLQSMHNVLRCPACRRRHKGASMEQLPTNFAVLNLATAHAHSQQGTEACQSHGDPVRLWCRSCKEPLCGQCLFERHMADTHHVVKIQAVVQEKKQILEQQTSELLDYVEEERASLAKEVHSIAHHLAWVHTRSATLTKYVKDVHRILKDVRKTTRMVSVLANENSLETLSSQLGKDFCEESKGQANTVYATADSQAAPLEVDCYNNSRTYPYGETPGGHSENNSNHVDDNDNSSRSLKLVDTENNRSTDTATDDVNTDKEDDSQSPYGNNKAGACGSDTDQDQDDNQVLNTDSGTRRKPEAEAGVWPLTAGDPVGGGSSPWPRIDWTNFCYQLPVVQLLVPPEKPEVILRLGVGDRSLGRVHIRLWGHLRRAQHFLALCLGTFGPTYKGSRFSNVARKGEPGESLVGGQYRTEDGSCKSQGLFEGLEWRGQYSGPVKAGVLGGASDGDRNLESFFGICTRDYPDGEYYCPFGEVVSGMEVVLRAVSHDPVSDITITNITWGKPDC